MTTRYRRTTRRALGAAVAALALAFPATLLQSAPASAVTVEQNGGWGGPVSYASPVMEAVFGTTHSSTTIAVVGMTVARADADGDQIIDVTYDVETRTSDGRWVSGLSQRASSTLGADEAERSFPSVQLRRPDAGPGRGEYRVRVAVSWLDVTTGYPLGVYTAVPSLSGDFLCFTGPALPCTPTPTGGVVV